MKWHPIFGGITPGSLKLAWAFTVSGGVLAAITSFFAAVSIPVLVVFLVAGVLTGVLEARSSQPQLKVVGAVTHFGVLMITAYTLSPAFEGELLADLHIFGLIVFSLALPHVVASILNSESGASNGTPS